MPDYEKLYFDLVRKVRALLPPDTEIIPKRFTHTFTERMAILEQLYSRGLITRDEYDAKRAEILEEL